MEAMNREEVIINDGTMQQYCINHPHRKNPAGICAFCLQEKLGKLVSSSSSSFPSSSSSSFSSPPSSSPSFRFNTLQTSSSSSSSLNSLSLPPTSSSSSTTKRDHHIRSRIPFLLPNKKKPSSHSSSANVTSSDSVFKRSKSTTTPRRTKFLDNDDAENGNFAFRKRNSFWSFLYLSSRPSSSCSKKMEVKSFKESNSSPRISTVKPKFCSSTLGRNCEMVVEEENEEEEEEEEVSGSSSGSGSLEQRKVSRSRSVGCGSRSFSGDLFEKISTGFGDCSLRRVESQREGKANKVISSSGCMKERVKCGGIFGGFMMMSSSSSYWVSSGDDGENSHGRSRSSWSWALASPMRAFTNKTTSKRDANSQNNNAPNLSAVPSLLTIKG